eukprot:1133646-Pelagomonas_calceolata.AAC.5
MLGGRVWWQGRAKSSEVLVSGQFGYLGFDNGEGCLAQMYRLSNRMVFTLSGKVTLLKTQGHAKFGTSDDGSILSW